MAYNVGLEGLIDATALAWPGIDKKRMFGGLCYLLYGNMAFGVHRDELIVRLGDAEKANEALAQDHTRPFDITGRPMKGWVMVAPADWRDSRKLARWLDAGRSFAESLPRK